MKDIKSFLLSQRAQLARGYSQSSDEKYYEMKNVFDRDKMNDLITYKLDIAVIIVVYRHFNMNSITS